MLQFDFDIRNYKITHNPFRTAELIAAMVLLVISVSIVFLQADWDVLKWPHIVALILFLGALFFFGRLVGIRQLYPREYIVVNSRKLSYKIGRGKSEKKIYRKNIRKIIFHDQDLIVLEKDTTQNRIDISHLSSKAREVLQNYLELDQENSQ